MTMRTLFGFVICFCLMGLAACNNQASSPCDAVHNGQFKIVGDDITYQIDRQGDTQIEGVVGEYKVQFTVEWISPCTYKMYDRVLLEGMFEHAEDMIADTTFVDIDTVNFETQTIEVTIRDDTGYSDVRTELQIVKTD